VGGGGRALWGWYRGGELSCAAQLRELANSLTILQQRAAASQDEVGFYVEDLEVCGDKSTLQPRGSGMAVSLTIISIFVQLCLPIITFLSFSSQSPYCHRLSRKYYPESQGVRYLSRFFCPSHFLFLPIWFTFQKPFCRLFWSPFCHCCTAASPQSRCLFISRGRREEGKGRKEPPPCVPANIWPGGPKLMRGLHTMFGCTGGGSVLARNTSCTSPARHFPTTSHACRPPQPNFGPGR